MAGKGYIPLAELEVYKLSRQLSKLAWEIYSALDWQDKKIMGDQFVSSADSVGANIAEGYGRYHYMDRVKFLYNSRGSLFESAGHWLGLLHERRKITDVQLKTIKELEAVLSIKLNNYIASICKTKAKTQEIS